MGAEGGRGGTNWGGFEGKEDSSAVLVECSEMNTNRIVVLNLISSFFFLLLLLAAVLRLGSGRFPWPTTSNDECSVSWVSVHVCPGVRVNKTFNLSQLFRARRYCLRIKKFFSIILTEILRLTDG